MAFGGPEESMVMLREWFDDLARDLRHGLRALVRRPGFMAIVVLTVGIGGGGSAAIFGAIDGILLTPLPYQEPGRLLTVWQHDRTSGDRQEVAPGNFLDWRERNGAFEYLTAMEPFGLDWQSTEGPVYLPTWLVYEDFFEVFGTAPLLGRGFRRDEHQPGRGDVVVLGYALWKARFAGAQDIVGRTLVLDKRPHTVVGVMPEGFAVASDDIVWVPKVLAGWEKDNRTSNFYSVFGRLQVGMTPQQANADLNTIAAQLARDYPRTNTAIGVTVVPLADQIVGAVRGVLWLLLGAVALVLAVITASVATMQLARAASRGREFAVRAALGAGPGRVARQLLAENFILAACSTALGFAVARFALDSVRVLAPADFPRVTELRADIDVLLFCAALTTLAVIITGIVPALLAGRRQLQTTLTQGTQALAGSRFIARAQSVLVTLQICISLVLLVGAGLLMRSFVSVVGENRGFRTDDVATVTIQAWDYYREPSERVRFAREVMERLALLPNVKAAGMTSSVPLMETIGAEQAPVAVEGAPPAPAGASLPLVNYSVVAGRFFEALAIPLRNGRLFTARDDLGTPPVVAVNETFVRQFFPMADPIGRRIILGGPLRGQNGPTTREIVGIVGDVRRLALHEPPRPSIYVPHAQQPVGANAFIVWGGGSPAAVLRQIKSTIWEVNPTLPIYRETTMADLVGMSVRERRFVMTLLSSFAVMALALAGAGMFGLMSYVTGQRTREFGVRLALGSERFQLLAFVMQHGVVLVIAGTLLGLVGAITLTRWMGSMLYSVTPLDPITFIFASVVLASTTILASLYPAWRAASTDPIRALRQD
jgi:putative ABC transport system permease protein